MTAWVDPTVSWNNETQRACFRRLCDSGELLGTWSPDCAEDPQTYFVRLAEHYCIWQPEIGGVVFTPAEPALHLYPLPDTDRTAFWTLVSRTWVPAIYPIWGRQVLHTSAVVRDDGAAIAFAGESGAGKSTLAYALSRRHRWSMLADDTLAFSITGGSSMSIRLHPLRLQSRLRSDAAAHFGKSPGVEMPFSWPCAEPILTAIYILDGVVSPMASVGIARSALPESYRLLLGQAHAMSLKDSAHNRQLMRDYATLAVAVDVFRLKYSKCFARLDEILDCLEAHQRADHLIRHRSSHAERTTVAAEAM